MNTPLWDELADVADTLAIAGQVQKPQLQTMRAAAVQMENWFVAVQDLREEKDAAMQRVSEQDAALQALADVFFHAAKFARREITMDAFATGMVDKAPFANIMVANGCNPVGSLLPPKRVRKTKEAV